jgi:hypothetical protein
MAYYDGSAGALVFETAITGTYSAGKTTTVELLRDPELTKACDLEEPYGISLIEVGPQVYGEGESDQLMPLLTVSEASRHFANQKSDPELLGERYSANIQHQIGFLATSQLLQARAQLARAFPVLRSKYENVTNAAAILGDRGHLDSEVYFDLNFPGGGHEVAAGIPVRRDRRVETITSLDAIFIADATEVPFERESARLAIQQRLLECYTELSPNVPYLLQGTPEERRHQIAETLGGMLFMPFVARNPLTAYLNNRGRL